MIGRFSPVFFFVLVCVCTSFTHTAQNPDAPGGVSSGAAAIIGRVDVSPQPHGLVIEIAVSTPVVPTSDRLTNPDRLVFDFPGCELQGANRRIPVKSGPVQELRLALFSVHPLVTRLVVASRAPVEFEVKSSVSKVFIQISFQTATATPAASPPPVPLPKKEAVEKEHAAPSVTSPKPAEPDIPVHAAASQPHAYALEAKAKALNLADLQFLEEKAATGDPEAETTLALAYHAAVLLKRDDAEALRLLHKAADQGFMAAQESLGIFSETGIGTQQPAPAEALEWYKRAVQQGSLDAATNIALMYAQGIGVPKDPGQAVTWFRQAAEGGDASAQYNLALMYGRGDGIPQDQKESVHWLTAAADQNVIPALMDLAVFYMRPPEGTTADVDRAIGYYEKAADLGSVRAQVILGNIFVNGALGKPDYEQAVKWYRKAAEQGQRDGQFGLAVCYALGQGVPAYAEEARRLFTAAADQGQQDAQYDLAIMLEGGKGIPEDRSLAEHYYRLAADQGMVKAQYRYGLMLAGSKESRSNRVSAYKWLMLAEASINESSAALSDLRKSMNQQEIAEAEQEVDNWRLAHRGSQR